jgi:hypothetical protein
MSGPSIWFLLQDTEGNASGLPHGGEWWWGDGERRVKGEKEG